MMVENFLQPIMLQLMVIWRSGSHSIEYAIFLAYAISDL